jgi:hypothetical protein
MENTANLREKKEGYTKNYGIFKREDLKIEFNQNYEIRKYTKLQYHSSH